MKRGGPENVHLRTPLAMNATPRADQLADIQERVIEIRELLVHLLQLSGNERAGAKSGGLLSGHETLIDLGDAVEDIWGKSATKTAESAHQDIVKIWSTKGGV